MTYPMLDNLHTLSEVLTTSFVVLGLGSLFVGFKLLVASLPARARSAQIAST